MQSAALAIVPNPEFVPRPAYENVRHFQGVTTFKPQPEATVKRERSQSDVLGLMYDRRQIGDILEKTGREFQKVHEAAGDKMRSSGDLREWVDGGRPPRDGVTDNQVRAMKLIIGWQRMLGVDGYQLLVSVLIDNHSIRYVADHGPAMPSKAATTFTGHLFRSHLTRLAKAMGFG